MKFDSKTMSPTALAEDVATLARLLSEAFEAEAKRSRIRRIRRALEHLATSQSFSFVLFLVLLLTLFLTVFEVLPHRATPLLLCYPFGLGLVLSSLDTLLAWRDRKILTFSWSLVWVVLLAIINSVLILVAVAW